MATDTETNARDRFLAQVELADERLERFGKELHDVAAGTRSTFEERAAEISSRGRELKDQLIDWPAVRVGTASAVEDLGDAIDTLEADFDAARQASADAYRSAVDRQLRTWRSRSDRLRVQSALASMDLRDDLETVGHRLGDARAGVLLELRNAGNDAKDVVIDLRDDIEEVLVDVRHAVERAAKALAGSD